MVGREHARPGRLDTMPVPALHVERKFLQAAGVITTAAG
jgi:hypothetical protein